MNLSVRCTLSKAYKFEGYLFSFFNSSISLSSSGIICRISANSFSDAITALLMLSGIFSACSRRALLCSVSDTMRWRVSSLPCVIVNILRFELVFYLRLLSRYADGYDAERDDIFGQPEHILHYLSAVHVGMQACPYSP